MFGFLRIDRDEASLLHVNPAKHKIDPPAFFTVAYSAYVDLQTAAYVFMAFYAWENWRSRKQIGWF